MLSPTLERMLSFMSSSRARRVCKSGDERIPIIPVYDRYKTKTSSRENQPRPSNNIPFFDQALYRQSSMSSLNTTSFEPSYDNCKNVSALCPVEATVYGDYFTLEPCALFAALFGACAVWQLVVVFWRRTWTFSAFLFVGTFIEFIGYVNRAQMSAPNGNPWNFDAFKNQLLTLILGPTFIAAAIALTFKWMVIRLGPQYSLFDPKWYPWTFVGSDVLSIAIQLAGGIVSGIAADGSGDTLLKAGDALLIAGTAFQTVNMSFCGGLMLFFWWRRSRAQRDMGSNEDEIEQLEPQRRTFGISDFKLFLWAIIPAYIAIVVRCIYR